MPFFLGALQRLIVNPGTTKLDVLRAEYFFVRTRPRNADPVIAPFHRLKINNDKQGVYRLLASADIGNHTLGIIVRINPLVALHIMIQLP
ncbi:hypothetical protein D3C81_1994100 [compost metagenome]